MGTAKSRIVGRIVTAIEMNQLEEPDKVSLRRMFAQSNVRKALHGIPDQELTNLDCLDVYEWASAIGDGYSIFGEWANRAFRYGYNGYHNSI